jgi:ribulose-5-phosphate 4-epimerase/fuculose-1-phosphate aldolase
MLTFYEKARAAELVAQACRVLGKQEMTHGALGHVSYRLDGDRMLIKAKGVEESALRFTEPKDIIEIDFNGDPVDGPEGLRPPSECFIHIQIMKAHPEVNTVIHCHPEHAVLMTIVDKEMVPIYGPARPGSNIPLEGLPIYPRSHTITTPEMGDALVSTMGESKVALMRGHGITAYGSNVKDATVRALALNEYVTMLYKAYLLGTPRAIPDEDIADMRRPQGPRTRGSAGGEASVLAGWRYYCGLTDEDPSAA